MTTLGMDWISRGCVLLILAEVLISSVLCEKSTNTAITESRDPLTDQLADKPASSRVTNTLQLVFVVSRHGNRGPTHPFPNYPYPVNDTNRWPYGAGQLTRRGLAQMRRLGMAVRGLYHGFLSELYRPETLRAVSSPLVRTIMSAQAFLSGLYPPVGPQVWDPSLSWQPIPVIPSEMLSNKMLEKDESSSCPVFTEELNEQSALLAQKYGAALKNISNYVQTYLDQLSDFHLNTLRGFWDSLKMADLESLPLPSWAGEVYPEPLETIVTDIHVQNVVGTDNMKRLFGGPPFKQIIQAMNAKVNGTLHSERRLYYFSGHDLTITVLKAILGLPLDIPNTGSGLVLELHRGLTNDYFIQVVYIDGKLTGLDPSPVELPQCPHPCSLNKLKEITYKYYNIEDYEKECNA